MAPPLPNVDQAEIPHDKLRDYCLNPQHPRGQHKARVFRSALGIGQQEWEYLRDQIAAALPSASIGSVSVSPFGSLYEVPILIEGLNGQTHEIITAWIVAEDGDRPRLTSAYVNIP